MSTTQISQIVKKEKRKRERESHFFEIVAKQTSKRTVFQKLDMFGIWRFPNS